MSTSELTAKAISPPRPGLFSRLFGGKPARSGGDVARRGNGAASGSEAGDKGQRGFEDPQDLARQMIADYRYAFLLLKEAAESVGEPEARQAWEKVAEQMALIPSGTVPVVRADGHTELRELTAFYVDRFAVTNRQYQRFVRAGGYDHLEIWPPEVWPSLMKFVDRTGRPGPLEWEKGGFPTALADHPVVGICWYEALAYARWVGKRLPTASEWQKAGGWPDHLSGGVCNRYPWGDVFDPVRTNLWVSGVGKTLPVREHAAGATLNGIYQMTGNVWEWLDDPLEAIPCFPGEMFHSPKPLRRIIGGAYNTYLQSEVTCQFITGQPELDRRENIGFRCAISIDRLRPNA